MEFKSATEEDKKYFRSLNRACYEAVVSQQFGSWQEELQHENFEAKWKEQIFKKIIIDGEIVGAFWLQELQNSNQLREIQIHPDHQGSGIGTLIIEHVIDLSRIAGKNLFLRVLFKNRAVSLYKRLGFVEIGTNEYQFEMQYFV